MGTVNSRLWLALRNQLEALVDDPGELERIGYWPMDINLRDQFPKVEAMSDLLYNGKSLEPRNGSDITHCVRGQMCCSLFCVGILQAAVGLPSLHIWLYHWISGTSD